MKRTAALLIVVLVWAAIYLPALGSLEIKGEEGRRILPAVTMLETGNYLVPQIGSGPYFSKPPLINWLVAGSFRLFGARNEWTARLPSAVCLLVAAMAFVTIGWKTLGNNGSVVAALAWLTNFGMVEKGRLIEIEALYVSLTALAFICWFSFHQQERSRWLTWTVPSLFLGLGLLAKGPLHLLFFYAVVIAILYQRRQLRQLLHPAHFVGLLVMAAVFASWAVPYLRAMQGAEVGHTWARQFSGRLAGEDFHLAAWIQNIPRGCAYFLPWLLLFLLARRVEFVDETERLTVRGLSWGIAVSFLLVSLLPGSLPRYTMPLLGPACCLLSMLLCAERIDLPRRLLLDRPAWLPQNLRLAAAIAGLTVSAVLLYAVALVPFLHKRQKVKSIAAQIDRVVPAPERLYAVDPDYQPYLFYVRAPIRYLPSVAQLPDQARFVLVQPANRETLVASRPLASPVLEIKDYRGRAATVYERKPN